MAWRKRRVWSWIHLTLISLLCCTDALAQVSDLDGDGEVDLTDFHSLQACLTGPAIPAGPACASADLNGDGQVDLHDFAILQRCFGASCPTMEARLEIGPIEGLTTVWHTAPERAAIPLDAVLDLRATVREGDTVFWVGAEETQATSNPAEGTLVSGAQIVFDAIGPYSVEAWCVRGDTGATELVQRIDVDVVDVGPAGIAVTSMVASVVAPNLDENSSNQTTKFYFSAGGVLGPAQLREDFPGHYRTALRRLVTVTVELDPPVLSPGLVEWSIDGGPPILAGTSLPFVDGDVGVQTITAGPPGGTMQLELERYGVTITSGTSLLGSVPDGTPITFTAQTTPPGFESDITWLSSTEFGTATPVLGTARAVSSSGSTFTVVFNDTFAPSQVNPNAMVKWVGVVADNAVIGSDPQQSNPLPCCCKDPTQAATGKEPCSSNKTNFGDPVYLFSGEFMERATDLRIKGRGLDFAWGRKYRSRFGPATTIQGNRWDCSYNIHISQNSDDLILSEGNARLDLYLKQPDGTWTKNEFFRIINLNPNGSYTLTFADTGTWEFNALDESPSAGKISAIIERNDNTLSFDYDVDGLLIAIHDPLDNPPANPRVITIAYNLDGFIESVTDFIGRQVRYEYYQDGDAGGSFGDLKSVTTPVVTGTPNSNDFPAGKTTIYTYSKGFADEQLNHNLLTVTDPKGQTYLTNTYATGSAFNFDHVVRQVWGNPGDIVDFTYLPVTPAAGNNFAVTRVIVNDRVGDVKESFIDARNRTVIFREFTGRADPDQPTTDTSNRPTNKLRPGDPEFFETRWEFNEDSLFTRVIHPNLNEEISNYDTANPSRRSQGNMIEHRRLPGPLGGDQTEIVETYEYDDGFGGGCCGTNFVTRHVDGRGHETLHTYDPNGNRLHTQHRIPSIIEDFTYNPFGQMTSHTLPDNGSSHRRRDEYTYYTAADGFQSGYRKQGIVDAGGGLFNLTTTYEYDRVGNMTRSIDPQGHDMQYVYNQLDQVARSISAEVTPGGGVRYERDTFYDANDNVVRVDIQNIDEAGILQANTHFTNVYEYEILNYRTRVCEEVGEFTGPIPGLTELPTCTGLPAADFITTEYDYDENRNRILVRYGEAVNGNQPDNVVQTLYDERDLVFKEIRAPGLAGAGGQSTNQYDYDPNKNVIQTSRGIEDAPRITANTYDGYDRIVGSVDPMGNTVEVHYDANHNRVSGRTEGELTDTDPGSGANVRLTEMAYVYDFIDRVIRTEVQFFDTDTQNPIDAGLRPADGLAVSETFWTDNSQVRLVLDDNLHANSAVYDTANRVNTVTDAENNTVTYTYDLDSLVVAVTEVEKSQLGNPDEVFTTTTAYDGLHRLTQTVDNVGNTHAFAYDSRDNRTVTDDALNHQTRYVYDGINRLTKTIRDLNGDGADPNVLPGDGNPDIVTTQTWDDTSRLTGQTDDSNNTTAYVYDALNRMTAEVMADCTQHAYTYDAHDNRLTMTDANTSVATCTYDLLDRLTDKSIAVGPGVSNDTTAETYRYDGLSRLVLAQDDDSRVTRSHDSLSRVTTETLTVARSQPSETNGTTVCLYDGVGNELESTYPGGRFIICAYDDLDRKQLITDATGPPATIATYAYVGPGRVTRREYGNGTRTDYTYDGITGIPNPPNDFGVKRIIGTTHKVIAGGTIIDDRTYTWDKMYNKTKREDVRPGPRLKHAYTYDDIYRLVRTVVTDENPPPITVRDTNYDLDGVGNREQVTGQPDPGSYTMLGQLCALPADFDMNQYTTTPFDNREYDENGNLTRIDDALPTQRNISYDYRNQMVEYTVIATGERHTYAYDALGRRIARITDAEGVAGGPTETRYFYDAWQVCEEQDTTAATQATYIYGLYIDEILNMQRGGSDFFYHTDDLYNVMAITNAAGTVVERYEYQDYGQPEFFDASSIPIQQSAIANPYLFTGRRYDPETHWYYYRTRYLDPVAGRFTIRDTIGIWGESLNLGNGYAYVGQNPYTLHDPWGRETCTCIMRGTTGAWCNKQNVNIIIYDVCEGFYCKGWLCGKKRELCSKTRVYECRLQVSQHPITGVLLYDYVWVSVWFADSCNL